MNIEDFSQWYRGSVVLNVDGDLLRFDRIDGGTNVAAMLKLIAQNRPKPGLINFQRTVACVSWPTTRQYRRGSTENNTSFAYVLKRDKMHNTILWGDGIRAAFAPRKNISVKQGVKTLMTSSNAACRLTNSIFIERISSDFYNLRNIREIIGEVRTGNSLLRGKSGLEVVWFNDNEEEAYHADS